MLALYPHSSESFCYSCQYFSHALKDHIVPLLSYSTFGELKTVRLPKKMSGTGPHRGFGFVDFLTKQDAKVSLKYIALQKNRPPV